jgi:hypothetical protein
MGIDGIGKKPPVAPDVASGAGGVSGATKTGATFEVTPKDSAHGAHAAQQAGALDASSPLARLRAGEIDVDGYLDLRVDEATKGLEGLPPTDLADLKSMLREKLVSDPGLRDLVQQATGHAPAVPED